MGYKNYEQQKAAHASMAEKKKSPAKMVPTSLRKKRKTQEDIRNEARKNRKPYKNKAAEQMAGYRKKKAQAEAAVAGRMSEKDMMKNEATVYDTDGPNVTVYGKKKSPAKMGPIAGAVAGAVAGKVVDKAMEKSPFKLKPKSPLMGKISASCKARAKKKFKVWPSAYASGWGVRCTQGKV